MKAVKKINVETKTIFFTDDEDRKVFKVGDPYYIDEKVVGVVAYVTLDDDKMEILVISLKDLCDNIDWYDACEKCENLPHGFYLPEKSDICLLAANMEKINAGMKKHGKPFKNDSCYWSSSEYSGNHAWVFCTNTSGGLNGGNEGGDGSGGVVRPVLKISKTI